MIAEATIGHLVGDYLIQNDWMAREKKRSHFACAVHCGLWTAAVLLAAGVATGWLAAWLFVTHYAIDRWGFVGWFMRVAGQTAFRDNLKPWSMIAVDNTFHLVTILIGFKLLV